MKRPNKKDDPNYPFEFPDTYLDELEKYCDKLEKALDKACKLMDRNMIITRDRGTMYLYTKDEWKEELMKDE